jgi:hypothetical protein
MSIGERVGRPERARFAHAYNVEGPKRPEYERAGDLFLLHELWPWLRKNVDWSTAPRIRLIDWLRPAVRRRHRHEYEKWFIQQLHEGRRRANPPKPPHTR